MADVIANGNGESNWEALPGLREYRDANPTPANVRWFVDVLNHILIENYLLRQELLRRDSADEDTALYEVTVAAPSAGPADSAARTRAEEEHRTGAGRGSRAGAQAGPRPATAERYGAGEQAAPSPGGIEHETVVSQLEALGDEIQSLRTEVRSALWQMPANRRSPLMSRSPSTPSSPRFEPIRSSQHDLTFEADPHPGLWMKLHQPWFYLPLMWATLLGILALGAWLIFFS